MAGPIFEALPLISPSAWRYDPVDIDDKTVPAGKEVTVLEMDGPPGWVLFAQITLSGTDADTANIHWVRDTWKIDATISNQQTAGATERGPGWIGWVSTYDTTNDVYVINFEKEAGFAWNRKIEVTVTAPEGNAITLDATGQRVIVTDVERFRRDLAAIYGAGGRGAEA